MEHDDGAADQFSLIGGALCLDFTNTAGGLRGRETQEYLSSYSDLMRWSHQAGLLATDEADRLAREALRRSEEAAGVFARAIALREAIYGIFTALLAGSDPDARDVATLNAELARALGRLLLAHSPDGFAWQWASEPGALDSVLWRIARSAADLLLSPAVTRLRQCASDTCGWLFIDTTKNRSRRWCDMRGCGNRVKARRHRARLGAARGATRDAGGYGCHGQQEAP